jgi:SAM-dependent methyltransferase
MPWYESWFGSDAYELVYDHRDRAEADRLVDLIVEAAEPAPGARILDMACGRGRHAVALAGRGYDVTGVDLSEASLAEARRSARKAGVSVDFRAGDMREAVCDGCFDGVVNLFTAFGYFDDPAEDRAALGAMAAALRPGGWFVQDFLNAPHVAATLEPEDTRSTGDFTIHQRRWIDDGRVHKEIEITDGERQETHRESVRLYTREALTTLYETAGLAVTDAFGDYDGSPHSADSPRLILVAEKG